ncbi:hypothetical protein Acr_29g0001850 [Actinidia rufa]|uniref:Uncharacterized protein n=1 Tax=Actinidia rufa TaxID=165716 RepID=A0A7J0HD33_9ERIC|nr:hypothetical protein Acr_29g0001850 [Actinidia rufa]
MTSSGIKGRAPLRDNSIRSAPGADDRNALLEKLSSLPLVYMLLDPAEWTAVVCTSPRSWTYLRSRTVRDVAGGDGGIPSNVINSTTLMTPGVALSSRWYNKGRSCLNNIIISANGWSVKAKGVDECDSTMGCDGDRDYQSPCNNNTVEASKAVWKALGVPHDQWGELDITWSDA